MAVAIGYDDRREILEVHDPMTHEVRETPYEELPKLREFSNHGALVAVPAGRTDLVAALDEAGAVECTYMTKTDEALRTHDLEQHDEADRLATEAIELHEPYELAWVYRFVRARDRHLEERTEERKAAVSAVLDSILRLWPEDEWPQQFLGRFLDIERFEGLVRLGRSEEAHVFGRAQCADAEDIGLLGYRAHVAGDMRLAVRMAEQALEEDDTEECSLHLMVRAAELAGDLDRAAQLWTRMKDVTTWHVHHEHLGHLALAAGDLARAREEIAAAVETGHVCPAALRLRAELRAIEGDREGALADALRARACVDIEHRAESKDVEALLAALAGRRDEARTLYEEHFARARAELSPADRARFAKVREALGVCV